MYINVLRPYLRCFGCCLRVCSIRTNPDLDSDSGQFSYHGFHNPNLDSQSNQSPPHCTQATLKEELSQINVILQHQYCWQQYWAQFVLYINSYCMHIVNVSLKVWLKNHCKNTGYYSIFQLSLLLLLNNYQYNCNNTISSVSAQLLWFLSKLILIWFWIVHLITQNPNSDCDCLFSYSRGFVFLFCLHLPFLRQLLGWCIHPLIVGEGGGHIFPLNHQIDAEAERW